MRINNETDKNITKITLKITDKKIGVLHVPHVHVQLYTHMLYTHATVHDQDECKITCDLLIPVYLLNYSTCTSCKNKRTL